jgi:hypothetical protein
MSTIVDDVDSKSNGTYVVPSGDHHLYSKPGEDELSKLIDQIELGTSNLPSGQSSDDQVNCADSPTLPTPLDPEHAPTSSCDPTAPATPAIHPPTSNGTDHPNASDTDCGDAAIAEPPPPRRPTLTRNGSVSSPILRHRSASLLRSATTLTAESLAAAAEAAEAGGGGLESPRNKGLRVSFCEQIEETLALLPPPVADDLEASSGGDDDDDDAAGPARVESSACCAVM